MNCYGITIIKQGCNNILKVTPAAPVKLIVTAAAPFRYNLKISGIGAKGKDADRWKWGLVNVTDAVDIVYDTLFYNTIAPIIFIDGVPFKWAKLGVVQNKKDQPGEEEETPFLDFNGYSLGDGTIAGEIDFQYLEP